MEWENVIEALKENNFMFPLMRCQGYVDELSKRGHQCLGCDSME